MADYPRFRDFSIEDKRLEGTKLKLGDIVNKEILITGFSLAESKYTGDRSVHKEYLTLEFEVGGEKHIVFTGSEVLSQQIQKYKENIPFYVTIKQIDRYYSFT